MTLPAYVPYFVFTGSVAIILALLFGLHRALPHTGWPAKDQAKVLIAASALLLGWFAIATVLGAMEVYRAGADDTPSIQYGILLPILIGASLIWRSDTLTRIIDAVPQEWIVGVQLYRALGVIFLILYASDLLPAQFALPAGLGDIAIGLAAPLVGYAYARMAETASGMVRTWNVFGILDLIVAVAAGFMTSPSRFQMLDTQPTSELMTMLPMVLIPTFLVPLSILLHVASLLKLRRGEAAMRGAGSGAGISAASSGHRRGLPASAARS